ncbi:MAG: CPBP family glutamic-type intramembrane protease [Desulfovibrio sp.]|jgi:membrane protease YdiL (CAAX protease family)
MNIRVLVEIFIIYYLPVSLILIGILDFGNRFVYLVLVGLLVIFISKLKRLSFFDLGLRPRSLKADLVLNALLSLIFILFFVSAYCLGLIGRKYVPQDVMFYIFYVFISCPLQEFLYRGYFFSLLNKANIIKSSHRIFLSALSFSYLHSIYLDFFTLVVTFAIGALWSYIYQKTNSIYGVCLSHIVFGTVTILAGLV